MEPLIHVRDKVALVTGGSRGIGEAIARAFGQSGATVAIASRKVEGVNAAAERLRAVGITVEPYACHTGKTEEIQRLVASVMERFGRIDVLVNNAATNPHFGPMLTGDDGVFDKTFEVNVRGYLNLAKEVAKTMIARNAPGSMIFVSSIAGTMASPLQGIYGMTKAAVISMTKTLAVELGPSKIRVNAIAPGIVETKFAQALITNKEIIDKFVSRTPLGRYGTPDEIAGGALYLASDAASFVTGHTLLIDGGVTAF